MISLNLLDERIAKQDGLVQAVHHAFCLDADGAKDVEVLVVSKLLFECFHLVLHRSPLGAKLVVLGVQCAWCQSWREARQRHVIEAIETVQTRDAVSTSACLPVAYFLVDDRPVACFCLGCVAGSVPKLADADLELLHGTRQGLELLIELHEREINASDRGSIGSRLLLDGRKATDDAMTLFLDGEKVALNLLYRIVSVADLLANLEKVGLANAQLSRV